MEENAPERLMYEIQRRTSALNRLTASFEDINRPLFGPSSFDPPKLKPAELGFVRCTAWFYSHYYETGKIGIKFLLESFSAYGLNPDIKHNQHYRLINRVRTYLQHNLDPNNSRNKQIQNECELWFRECTGTTVPDSEAEWLRALLKMQSEALEFLETLESAVRKIEADESRDSLTTAWKARLDGYHPPHKFDTLIAIVAADMGRDSLDPTILRAKHYDEWCKVLKSNKPGYDFENEARKLIELALISDGVRALPITGKDLMARLDIRPGAELDKWLTIAWHLHLASPCKHEDLISRIADAIRQSQTV